MNMSVVVMIAASLFSKTQFMQAAVHLTLLLIRTLLRARSAAHVVG